MELTILGLLFGIALYLEKKYKIILYNSLKERWAIVGVTFFVIVAWELVNRHVYKAWVYPGSGLIKIFFLGLPLEVYVFSLVAPYFGFTVYELLHRIDKRL